MKISDFLLTGKKNGISMTDLAHIANVPERIVRKEILQARIAGELILSGDEGYYLAENDDEIREYVISRKAAIKTTSKALQPFIRKLNGKPVI